MYAYRLTLRINGVPVTLDIQSTSRDAAVEVANNVWDMYDNSPNPAHEVRCRPPCLDVKP